MIACLGWGSLIWDRRKLAVEGQWQTDGPKLPVEFTRVSGGERLTLVITDGAVPVTVLWSRMTVASLDDGIKNLSEREDARRAAIAFWSPDRSSAHDEASIVGEWAAARDFSSVIWTRLKPGFPCNRGEPLTHQQALDHLRGLAGDNRKNAEEYVRRAPDQVKTVYRTAIEAEFGWTPAL